MITKMFEVLDKGTFIPVVAVQMIPSERSERERYLLGRAGYHTFENPLVVLLPAHGHGRALYDPYSWGDRTYSVAHEYITKYFDILETGAVVDVEFVLGEVAQSKVSEVERY